jgi:hypothetical protein
MGEIIRLGRGGWRPGAGRKVGSTNKHTGASIAADLKEALGFLERINGRIDHLERRFDTVVGRLSAVDRSVGQGAAATVEQGQATLRRLLAIERAVGLVEPPQAPRLTRRRPLE